MAERTAQMPQAPPSIPGDSAVKLLQSLSKEIRDLDLGRAVDRVPLSALTSMRFATEYVQRNKPVVITGAMRSWPAMSLWGEAYLTRVAGGTEVTVDVTPNGRGDAVTRVADPRTGEEHRWFVTPHERRMTLADFFQLMRRTRKAEAERRRLGGAAPPREVPYMQHQNSNLTEELPLLTRDVGPGLPWAEEVFGGPPEATNLWIGDARSTTSFHKDHYENLYGVVRGTKIFTLLPPCDVYRMYLVRCPAATFVPYREVAAMQASCTAQQGISSTGAVLYGRVSPEPGRALVQGAVAAGNAAGEQGGGSSGGRGSSSGGGGGDGGSSGCRDEELVAVLKDPPFSVVWSAVDTTCAGPETRAAQSLFYGGQGQGQGPAGPDGQEQPCGACGGGGGGAARAGLGNGQQGEEGEQEEDSEDGDNSPLAAAGGSPLVVEVGPGEVLYLPSMWYHQVGQREAPAAVRQQQQQPYGSTRQQCGKSAAEAQGTDGEARVEDGRAAEEEEEGAASTEDGEQEYVIAVNYWYDMKYDSRFTAFKLAEGLAVRLGLAPDPEGA